jgi:hypothetical protein
MEARFVGGARTVIEDAVELKPIVDEIDELLGQIYGLTQDEVEYVKQYDAEYGRGQDESEGTMTTLVEHDSS